MWIMTDAGYVSAVVHRDDASKLMVRARDLRSLEYCVDGAGVDRSAIYQDFPSDYPWRVVLTRRQFKTFLKVEVNAMWYTNFKNAATNTTGRVLHDFYMRIWTASHVLTSPEDKKKNDKAWKKLSKKNSKKFSSNSHYFSSFGHVEPDPEPKDLAQIELDMQDLEDLERSLGMSDPYEDIVDEVISHHDMTEQQWLDYQSRENN